MSTDLIFTVLPFDPTTTPDAKIQLPILLEEFALQLRSDWPEGEVLIENKGQSKGVILYISTERLGRWNIAGFLEKDSQFYVMGWPKKVAKGLILWYRNYVNKTYPLFIVVSDTGDVIQLTEHTSPEDLENLYPYPGSDD